MIRRGWARWGWGSCVVVTAGLVLAVGCSDRFGVCHVGDCVAHRDASGGAGGEVSETPNVAGKSSDSVQTGGTSANGGTSELGNDGGAEEMGGAGGAPDPVVVTPVCAAGYHDWLSSSFSFPDGDVLGTADFPSMPWVPTGQLAIASGRVRGAGSALISQGSALSYADSRIRFRGRFTDSHQTITVAINAAADAGGGLRIMLDSSGELIVMEGQAARGQVDFEPLESDVDWFVEASMSNAGGSVSVSKGNYPRETGSSQKASLRMSALKLSADGSKAAVRLESSGGISPALDELSVALCGKPAPAYEARLVDDFERSNSTSLGNAQIPANAAWLANTSGTTIVNGALQTIGDLRAVAVPLEVPLNGLRVRTTVSAASSASGPYLWSDVNFNVEKQQHGASYPGFWMWGDLNGPTFNTGLFEGGKERQQPTTVVAKKYYVQMDRDGDAAVLVVRNQSFDGPILGMQYAGALTKPGAAGGYLTLADEGGGGTRFEDIRVDVYPTH